MTGEAPVWENLQVMHAWGGHRQAGFYSTVAAACGQRFLTVDAARTQAKTKSPDETFDFVCTDLNRTASMPELFRRLAGRRGPGFAASVLPTCLAIAQNAQATLLGVRRGARDRLAGHPKRSSCVWRRRRPTDSRPVQQIRRWHYKVARVSPVLPLARPTAHGRARPEHRPTANRRAAPRHHHPNRLDESRIRSQRQLSPTRGARRLTPPFNVAGAPNRSRQHVGGTGRAAASRQDVSQRVG